MSIAIGALAIVLAIVIFVCSCVPSQNRVSDTEGVSLLIASALFLIAAAIAFH